MPVSALLVIVFAASAGWVSCAQADKKGTEAPGGAAIIDWVTIPGGQFAMGAAGRITPETDPEFWDEVPPRVVTVDTFELARTEVTFGQYRACVKAGACAPPHLKGNRCLVAVGNKWEHGRVLSSLLGDDQPVVCVIWEQAQAFSRWVGGRLPSEAEWEYAARSGGKDHYYPGGHVKADCSKFVMAEGGRGCGRYASWPVCSKPAGNTEQGLCDMAGNVWEWVADWYHKSYYRAPEDGSAWLEPKSCCKVRRGGSWHFSAAEQRTLERTGSGPSYLYTKLGFRPARSL